MAPLADFLVKYIINTNAFPAYLKAYIPGQSYFSTHSSVAAMTVTYLAVIFGIQATLKQPLKLALAFQAHNLMLSVASFFLLYLILEEIVPIIWEHGFFYAICAHDAYTPRLELYYMINYYYKYWEFVDTIFVALKGKPLQFLHVYHHFATALLSYFALNARGSNSWYIVVINLSIHVVMYYYYFATARGARFWWKKYLTTVQISQFVADDFLLWFCFYTAQAYQRFPSLPHMGDCSGSTFLSTYSISVITSYLALFIRFYFRTYKEAGASKANGSSKANGHGLARKTQ